MTDVLGHVKAVLADAVVDDRDNGIIRANRRIFTDEEIFELEMQHIFEGNWIYLAHESQVPNPGDYITTYIGRQPVVITRDQAGELHCLINACAHRGAMICRRKTDNRMTLTCPFHGWTFRNDGTLLKVKDPDDAGYPDAHTGLIAAIETVFQGSSWQRCRVHFMRNVLVNVPKTAGPMVASIIRTIFAQPDPEHVYAQFDEVVRMLTRSHPKIAGMLETARTDLLAFAEFPYPHWRQIWSTNPLSVNRLSGDTLIAAA